MPLAGQYGLLMPKGLAQLQGFANQREEFCDEMFAVIIEPKPQEFAGFQVWWRKYPALRYAIDDEANIHHGGVNLTLWGIASPCEATRRGKGSRYLTKFV